MEDHFLINQVVSGNQGAYKFLVIRYERPIFRFLGTFALSRPVIEELAQETFLRAYKNIGSYDSKKGASFSAWLFTIAKNLAINECSRSGNQAEIGMSDYQGEIAQFPSESPSQEEALSTSQTSEKLRHAIQMLPEEFRIAVSLSYLKELSMEEIAAIVKCSVGTVKSRIFRGKSLLREALFVRRENFI